MELPNTNVLFFTIIVLVISLIVKWVWDRKQAHKFLAKYGIRGPKPSLILGNYEDYRSDTIHGLTKLINKYGDICSFYSGTLPLILVADLESIRQICITQASKFRNKIQVVTSKIKPLSDGLLTLRDERWKISRQSLSPTFSAAKMRWMIDLMDGPIETFMQKLSRFADKRETFDFYKHAEALTLEVIGRCAFGTEVNCQKDLNDPFLRSVSNFMKHTENFLIVLGVMFPGLEKIVLFLNKYAMPTGYRIRESTQRLNKIIQNRSRSKKLNPPKDLLQLMLNANAHNTDQGRKMTDEEILGNAFSFVIAGFETTATAISFVIYLLAKYPEYQEQLYEHILDNVADKPTYDDVMFGLPLLDQIVNESLRYYPPVPIFTSRECSETCEINGQVIPKGSAILIPVYHIHHKEEYWPNPSVFDPSRFAPENKANIVPNSFMPFGTGQRNCIGMRFALLEMKLTIVEALKKFKFQFSDKTEDPLKVHIPFQTLYAPSGINLTVTKRS